MIDILLKAVEESDTKGVSQWWDREKPSGEQAWELHQTLFSVAQRVLNPPFINPHLPKMYRICREFLPYLAQDDIPPLVWLEISEYTSRPKLKPLPQHPHPRSPGSFEAIGAAIRDGEPGRVASLMGAFMAESGKAELARNLLLLGSGYLEQSLGHSVSCTAFILLEMMERPDQDPWPALALLADYFCKGQFHAMPQHVEAKAVLPPKEVLDQHLMRASSGNGIVNLHHTITRYSIERVRHLLTDAEYAHMLSRWVEFIGEKSAEAPLVVAVGERTPDYGDFYAAFSRRDEGPVLQHLAGMLASEQVRRTMGRYLVRGVCDLYQGQYNPHFLTGLGSALWVADRYREQPPIALNALRQYVNYFFAR